MREQEYITSEQEKEAATAKLQFSKIQNKILAPHFVFYVKDLLVQKYGLRFVEQGGLNVTTTLDLDLQEYAQASVSGELDNLNNPTVTNGAAMITRPGTGEILAMIGSRDYFDEENDGNVNVTIAHRQPGSSIKPINYATGLALGHTAATPFIDIKKCFPNPGQAPYCPVNYDGNFHGVVQMRYALANSYNIPAVKMLKVNGLEAMIATASAMGITTFGSPDKYGLSLTLGGGETTMRDMTEAFGVFANNGYRIPLVAIKKVTDRKGKVIEEYKPVRSPIFGQKVLPDGVAYIISHILSDNGARSAAFGANSELKIGNYPVAVKTGTTNDLRDNWTIGYTPSYVVAVWVGNNDNKPMRGVVSGVTGAAPMWHDIMAHLVRGNLRSPFKNLTML
jgi:membrane peptidoglycan carboxypeptidase